MNGESYVVRSTMIAARGMGDETMVMSAASSTLFTLNEVATVIWEAADGLTSIDEIVEGKICAQFEVTADVARVDAEEVIDVLVASGLLLVSDRPIPAMRRTLEEDPCTV
jgi:hypothetical protein